MSIKTRFDPIDRDVELFLTQDMDPRAASKALAAFAREQFTLADQQNTRALGRKAPHDTFVDGRASENLEAVKPDGTIVFEWQLVNDALAWIHQQLVQHSPVKTGRYSRSHVLLADGDEVDPTAPPLNAREFVYINDQPYSRKIERGLSNQAPDGVYQVVATLASRRFGNVARVRFGYRSILGGSIGQWAGSTSMQRRGRRMNASQRRDWLTRQPAIIVTL